MKFKAVVVTRKKLIIAAISCAVIAATGVFEATTRVNVKLSDDTYSSIISSAVGEGARKPDFKEMLKVFLGFDIERPETIIDGYMGIDTDNENTADEEEPQQEQKQAEPPFPSKEEIAAAAGELYMNNATEYNVDLKGLCAGDLGFKIEDNGKPQVLIMHTHTTECYSGDEMPGETERTTDTEKSVAAVGDVIASTLEEYGISTYHDTTFHDYPSYQGAYTRSLATVTELMKKYPSVKIVLDVHRDAFVYTDGTRLRVVDENADAPTAQVMLVSGTDSMGLDNPNWRENLKFAAKIQNAARIMYPGLMRSIDLRTERFNLHMTTGSLILEVGSNGNTLEEAKNAGRDIARVIAAVLAN